MAEKKPEAEEVHIRRSKIVVPAGETGTTTMIYVTYTVRDLPPGLITIPEAEWSAEKEAELVRKDIAARRAAKPTTIRI